MRVATRLLVVMAGAGLFALALTTNVSAQICGDADGNGSVTVSDGVAVLRQAASLPSGCSERATLCDIDGNGSVSVTDGVNVLRKVAELPVTDACPGGGNNADVAALSDLVVPFIVIGVSQAPHVSAGSATAAGETENCEDGGSRTTTTTRPPPLPAVTATFTGCQVSPANLGRFRIDGTISATFDLPPSVTFHLDVVDLDTNRFADFIGTIQGAPDQNGGFAVDGGPISVTSSENGPEVFRITFHELRVDANGNLVSGSADATDTSNSFSLDTATFTVVTSTTATIHVVRDDDTTTDFDLDLQTGDLTPK